MNRMQTWKRDPLTLLSKAEWSERIAKCSDSPKIRKRVAIAVFWDYFGHERAWPASIQRLIEQNDLSQLDYDKVYLALRAVGYTAHDAGNKAKQATVKLRERHQRHPHICITKHNGKEGIKDRSRGVQVYDYPEGLRQDWEYNGACASVRAL
jgi:hypothetical protein